ncbi:hypothetical protein BDP27DRAFT_1433617 [Rhodocollybia butyracea]|uniref:Uncharacterized protein n=1 Tax=Rhodocollybia butyracea TaxID=206335 RepID=A0A9P5P870_9AGAR|nr:hypothetical protein BDP27DRAFT_1433617 [Rhodocollybia butyracea]
MSTIVACFDKGSPLVQEALGLFHLSEGPASVSSNPLPTRNRRHSQIPMMSPSVPPPFLLHLPQPNSPNTAPGPTPTVASLIQLANKHHQHLRNEQRTRESLRAREEACNVIRKMGFEYKFLESKDLWRVTLRGVGLCAYWCYYAFGSWEGLSKESGSGILSATEVEMDTKCGV